MVGKGITAASECIVEKIGENQWRIVKRGGLVEDDSIIIEGGSNAVYNTLLSRVRDTRKLKETNNQRGQ
jgi:hypothetical protein